MQIQINLKNVLIFCVGLFFLYLAYLLCFADSVSSSKLLLPAHISVNIRDVISYCVLAAEIGGSAIIKVHKGKSFWKRVKSKTDVGIDEFVTNADIISHQLILESLKRAPGLNVSYNSHDVPGTGASIRGAHTCN
uniref:inositol-phosphate phosphatase n=1 Tax=Romanomermis culicivorax TaxID=13658 RepID=A0A915IK82_ROMCU